MTSSGSVVIRTKCKKTETGLNINSINRGDSDNSFIGASAGGDLSGTYPNPSIAPGTIGASNLKAMPGVRLIVTNGQIVPTNFGAQLNYFSEEYDTLDFYPGSGNIVTIPLNGAYAVTAAVILGGNASGQRYFELHSNVFGTRAAQKVPGNAQDNYLSVNTIQRFNAGEKLSLNLDQDSGTNLFTASSAFGAGYLAIQWLGP